ncbi:acyl-CoA dehydrogenase [Calothrix sp. NIES-4101]|nr:acyl-CoA dehydrogenase [Calothrix sp. NIES-4101]
MISQHRTIELSLAERAGWLNDGIPGCSVAESLVLLGNAGRLTSGVPESLGGIGGTILGAIEEISSVSEQCLTSGFVFWCQRTFIEFLTLSSNHWLRHQILPKILQGERSGSVGFANAMKHLVGIEPLQVKVSLDAETVTLDGFLPWVSNLQPHNFVVAIAAQANTGEKLIIAVPSGAKGLERGEDLQLLGLQGSWTSTLHLNQVRLSRKWIISEDADSFLASLRPAFLMLQCGLGLGITRRSNQETLQSIDGSNQSVLANRLRYNTLTLIQLEAQLWKLSALSSFENSDLRELLELRLALFRLAVDSVCLELEAKGETAYFKPSGTARRLREVAFLPNLTPSLLELGRELQQSGNIFS